jgi:hypothetical protein
MQIWTNNIDGNPGHQSPPTNSIIMGLGRVSKGIHFGFMSSFVCFRWTKLGHCKLRESFNPAYVGNVACGTLFVDGIIALHRLWADFFFWEGNGPAAKRPMPVQLGLEEGRTNWAHHTRSLPQPANPTISTQKKKKKSPTPPPRRPLPPRPCPPPRPSRGARWRRRAGKSSLASQMGKEW